MDSHRDLPDGEDRNLVAYVNTDTRYVNTDTEYLDRHNANADTHVKAFGPKCILNSETQQCFLSNFNFALQNSAFLNLSSTMNAIRKKGVVE